MRVRYGRTTGELRRWWIPDGVYSFASNTDAFPRTPVPLIIYLPWSLSSFSWLWLHKTLPHTRDMCNVFLIGGKSPRVPLPARTRFQLTAHLMAALCIYDRAGVCRSVTPPFVLCIVFLVNFVPISVRHFLIPHITAPKNGAQRCQYIYRGSGSRPIGTCITFLLFLVGYFATKFANGRSRQIRCPARPFRCRATYRRYVVKSLKRLYTIASKLSGWRASNNNLLP